MESESISYRASNNSQYGSVYVESIDGDGEFDHGPGSGWMYNVDGDYLQYGADKHLLEGGENIEWRYTTNLGEDLGEDLSQWEDKDKEDPKDQPQDSDENKEKEEDLKDGEEKEDIESLDKIYKDLESISDWALDAVDRATKLGFVEGFKDKFNPKADITRAEFVKIIVSSLDIVMDKEKSNDFSDVDRSDWFYSYVNAAYEAGIIKGSGNKFRPNDKITREEMAVIIVRALNLEYEESKIEIKDFHQVSDWAKKDVKTVVAKGLIIGSDGKFNSKDKTTREMATVVLMRVYDYKNK